MQFIISVCFTWYDSKKNVLLLNHSVLLFAEVRNEQFQQMRMQAPGLVSLFLN